MKHLYLALALGAACAPAVSAQTFHHVTGSIPADGSTQVAQQSGITFTFSKPLADGLTWEDVEDHLSIYPEEAVTIQDFVLSEDRTRFTVYVSQQPNTVYHWVVSGLMAADGSRQFRNRSLTYITGFDLPVGQVSGTLSDARLNAKTASTSSIPMFPTLFDGGLVMIVHDTEFLDAFSDVSQVAGVAVPANNGTFTVNHLAPGTYYAFAFGASWNEEYMAMGWYDSDGDGQPDPFVVESEPVAGIDFPLYDFAEFMLPVSSAQTLEATRNRILSVRNDATLRYGMGMELIGFPQADLTGRSMFWNFTAYSPSAGTALEAVATRYMAEVTEYAPDEAWVDPTHLAALPETHLGSETAAAIAMQNGAADHLSDLPEGHFTLVSYSIGLPAETGEGPLELPDVPYWFIQMTSMWVENGDQPQQREFHIAIHAVTGEVLAKSTTSVEDEGPMAEAGFRLDANYPNPFNPTTVVRYQLTVDSKTRLAVYDLLGREVAVLVDGMMPAGEHTAAFDAAGLSSGVYVYRLTSGGQVLSRTMTLIR